MRGGAFLCFRGKESPLTGAVSNVMMVRKVRGFTLLELLLSISIMAMAAGIIYGSINTGLEAARKTERKNELFQKVRIIRGIIANDIANAYIPKQNQGFLSNLEEVEDEIFIDEGSEFDLSKGYINALTGKESEGSQPPLDRMEFFTVAKGTFENDMPVYVSYYIDEDPLSDEAGLVVNRIATVLPAESFRKELAREVVGLDIRYLDSTPEGQEWVNAWEEKRNLPRAVEVTLIWDEESRMLCQYTDVPILITISSTHIF